MSTQQFQTFVESWANPGFRFANFEDYWVLRDLVKTKDSLHVEKFPELGVMVTNVRAQELFSEWALKNLDLRERGFNEVINFIVHQQPLADWVVQRLPLFMESDSYILQTLPLDNVPRDYGLITKDFRLAAQVLRAFDENDDSRQHRVFAVDPLIFLLGRLEEIPWTAATKSAWRGMDPPMEGITWREDPGAVLFTDYTEFKDGMHIVLKTFHACYGNKLFVHEHRKFPGVWVATMDRTPHPDSCSECASEY